MYIILFLAILFVHFDGVNSQCDVDEICALVDPEGTNPLKLSLKRSIIDSLYYNNHDIQFKIFVIDHPNGIYSYWRKTNPLYYGTSDKEKAYHRNVWRVYILTKQLARLKASDFIPNRFKDGYHKLFNDRNIGGVFLEINLSPLFLQIANNKRFATILSITMGHDTFVQDISQIMGIQKSEAPMDQQHMKYAYDALLPIFQALKLTEIRAADNEQLQCKYVIGERPPAMKSATNKVINSILGGKIMEGPKEYSRSMDQAILRIFDPDHFDDPFTAFGLSVPSDGIYQEFDWKTNKVVEGKTLTTSQMNLYLKALTKYSKWGNLMTKMKEKGLSHERVAQLTNSVLKSEPNIPPKIFKKTPIVRGAAHRLTRGAIGVTQIIAAPFKKLSKLTPNVGVVDTANAGLDLVGLAGWNKNNINDKQLSQVVRRLWYGHCEKLGHLIQSVLYRHAFPALNKLIEARQYFRMKIPQEPQINMAANDYYDYDEYVDAYDEDEDDDYQELIEELMKVQTLSAYKKGFYAGYRDSKPMQN